MIFGLASKALWSHDDPYDLMEQIQEDADVRLNLAFEQADFYVTYNNDHSLLNRLVLHMEASDVDESVGLA